MTPDERLAAVLGKHLPRDRYDDDGPIGTECTCGGWEGDYFAGGEAGPFDLHLAAALADAGYVHRDEVTAAREAAARAMADDSHWDLPQWARLRLADAALKAAVTEHLGGEGRG